MTAVPASLAGARGWLTAQLEWLSPDVLETAKLLATEVLSNAIRHSESGDDVPLALTVRVSDSVLRVEVADAGPCFDPTACPPGWGIYLLDKLADRWHVTPLPGHCAVWFELDLPQPA